MTLARVRNSNRDEAKKQWLASGGNLTTKELAAAHGVPEQRIRKWKSEDKWGQELTAPQPKRRGGQKGNQNAVGHGAPEGNNNAETHGAYSRVHLDNLTPEEREYIESLTLDIEPVMLREYQLLMAKERDLICKIKEYKEADPSILYIDRVVEMHTPNDKDNTNKKKSVEEDLEPTMRTVIKASSFDRIMKLEAEYNKLHGRILKLIDSIRAQGIDIKRLDLDERKHTLAKQRLSGEYIIDPDTGELDDTTGAEDIEV